MRIHLRLFGQDLDAREAGWHPTGHAGVHADEQDALVLCVGRGGVVSVAGVWRVALCVRRC